jgi:multidrug efflux pump subunit AcrA (membrane-fusion protein)
MSTVAPARDLERRKQVRLRLRADIQVEAQRYEGRIFYVLKDPVSLRYYRLKENEHYLLQFLDGKHTLEDAQKSYEKQYRPERLKLEDLEAFGQQLINAGLAQNESPRAGQQLFEQRGKRVRSEWMQTLTNILYIKIPLIDPDRLLTAMLRVGRGVAGFMTGSVLVLMTLLLVLSVGIFVTSSVSGGSLLAPRLVDNLAVLFPYLLIAWTLLLVWRGIHALSWVGYVFLGIALMISAGLMVLLHFDTFMAKLPSYREYFNFTTIGYLWLALAVVKVIHEFGHGISCKMFGGEVHELGLLFLCFSPAMYCNVSDAWKMPNKWHRIMISFAGIYVELVIASLATFVWWNYDQVATWIQFDPIFVRNLSLALMVVCSVSTVIFNGNPLMRYDGYYILADWIEIPNLREKANRYLSNLFMEHCLGVEVQPEPYMALGRRIGFVVYAIVSYFYKWFVTFSILVFMYNFLKPYKLQALSVMLAFAAAASIVGWPIYRVGKNIYRRGRLPDMKRWRVIATATVGAGLVLFIFLVPFPRTRVVRAVGLVEAHPEATSKVYLRFSSSLMDLNGATLTELNVRDGQKVEKGDVLAKFVNRDLDRKLATARSEQAAAEADLNAKQALYDGTNDPQTKSQLKGDIDRAKGERDAAATTVASLEKTLREDLILRAPRSGVVRGAPRLDDVGKFFEKDPSKPFCTITEPGRLCVMLPVETAEYNRIRQDAEQESEAAKTTRRHLQRAVSLHCDKKPLGDVLDELGKSAGGKDEPVTILRDDVPEILRREPVTLHIDRQPVAAILERLLERYHFGYVVRSEDPNDGAVQVRPGQERGYPDRPRHLDDLEVTIRIQGRHLQTLQGRIQRLPQSDAQTIPAPLSNKFGGPVAVKSGGGGQGRNQDDVRPQTQHYLVYVDILGADETIAPGNLAEVKVQCKPETIARWAWRKINEKLDLGL